MKRLTDTAAAAALCAMCAVFAYNGAEIAVAAVLLTFAAALFTVYFDMRWAALAVNTVYALACFKCPELCAGCPRLCTAWRRRGKSCLWQYLRRRL